MLAAKVQRSAVRPFSSGRTCAVTVQASKVSLAGLVQDLAKTQMKKDFPAVTVGDTVKVGLGVVEGNGKTRTQTLDGILIAESGGGIDKTITFRRVFQGVGVELIIPVHSPVLQNVEFVRRGRVRRSKLFFLRDRMGKAARLKEVVGVRMDAPASK